MPFSIAINATMYGNGNDKSISVLRSYSFIEMETLFGNQFFRNLMSLLMGTSVVRGGIVEQVNL